MNVVRMILTMKLAGILNIIYSSLSQLDNTYPKKEY